MKIFTPILVLTIAIGLTGPATIFGQGQESDDFGFPIESTTRSTAQNRGPTIHLAQRTRSTIERRLHPGRGFWANRRASRSMKHARDYSRDLYSYSRGARVIRPEVAKSESERLGRNIELAKKEIETVRKAQEGNKEVNGALESIGKHLAKAAETHAQLHEECCKDSPDGHVSASCCSEITKELDKALAEHGALMRTLESQVDTDVPKK